MDSKFLIDLLLLLHAPAEAAACMDLARAATSGTNLSTVASDRAGEHAYDGPHP
jgi:hypothetical protein